MRFQGYLYILYWLLTIHVIGIWLFVRGFLLTRLALSEVNSCDPSAETCSLPPAYNRAVIIIIDSLRFDFISPNPPVPPSSYYHHVLKAPAELSKSYPDRSTIFCAFSDPPTTTSQRIKGITTGSLPTFIEMGYNFGASSVLEDSLIRQLHSLGKRVSRSSFIRNETIVK